MTLSPKRLEHLRAIASKGGAARAKGFTSESQKAARAKVKRESLVASGRKGWRVLYGKDPDAAGRILADWRKKNPSTPETIVDAWLNEFGSPFECEVPLHELYLDRVVGLVAIEIDGAGLHNDRAPEAAERLARDRRKDALCYALGLTLIRLPESQVKNGSARTTLMEALHANTRP